VQGGGFPPLVPAPLLTTAFDKPYSQPLPWRLHRARGRFPTPGSGALTHSRFRAHYSQPLPWRLHRARGRFPAPGSGAITHSCFRGEPRRAPATPGFGTPSSRGWVAPIREVALPPCFRGPYNRFRRGADRPHTDRITNPPRFTAAATPKVLGRPWLQCQAERKGKGGRGALRAHPHSPPPTLDSSEHGLMKKRPAGSSPTSAIPWRQPLFEGGWPRTNRPALLGPRGAFSRQHPSAAVATGWRLRPLRGWGTYLTHARLPGPHQGTCPPKRHFFLGGGAHPGSGHAPRLSHTPHAESHIPPPKPRVPKCRQSARAANTRVGPRGALRGGREDPARAVLAKALGVYIKKPH